MHVLQQLVLGSAALVARIGRPESCSKAIYAQTNDPASNSVIVLPMKDDGKLGKGAVYPTGGKGGLHNNGSAPFSGITPDGLLSQNSVTVAGQYVFVTNAGSNSASMFKINPYNAAELKNYGAVPVNGDFPVSIAASTKHNLACVVSTGKQNGVSCARFNEYRGLGSFDALRPLGLVQTTPPAGIPNTASEITFSQDEDFIVVSAKADPPTGKPGVMAIYPVQNNKLSTTASRSSPNGTVLLFGFDQVPNSLRFVVSDPAYGAALLDLNHATAAFETFKLITIPNRVAPCWTVISPTTKSAFIADGNSTQFVEIDYEKSEILNAYNLPTGNTGLFDIKEHKGLLYAAQPGFGLESMVSVIAAKNGKLVQQVGLGYLGVTNTFQGMAIYARS